MGKLMMVLGGILILSGILLLVMNTEKALDAANASAGMLPGVYDAMAENVKNLQNQGPTEPEHVNPYDNQAVEKSNEMTVVVKNSWPYIGCLSMPSIEMELPVLSEWSFHNLGMAPCRHMGSTKSDDIVICAHNYYCHFGHIHEMAPGDPVYFTDMDGIRSEYSVVTVAQISPDDIDMVTDESLDLVLYTCTYGGQNRIMVGCQRTGENPY